MRFSRRPGHDITAIPLTTARRNGCCHDILISRWHAEASRRHDGDRGFIHASALISTVYMGILRIRIMRAYRHEDTLSF